MAISIKNARISFPRDKSEGGSYTATFLRKVVFCTYYHFYEWHVVSKYLKGIILNVGSGRDSGRKGVISLDSHMEFDQYQKVMVKPDVIANAYDLPFADDTIDCVVSMHMLEHLEDPWCALTELIRVTKTAKFVCILLPDVSGNLLTYYRRNPTHLQYWSRWQMQVELSMFLRASKVAHIIQYCKTKRWLNKWSFDFVLRKL